MEKKRGGFLHFILGALTGFILACGLAAEAGVFTIKMPGEGNSLYYPQWINRLLPPSIINGFLAALKVDWRAKPLPYTLHDIDGEPEKASYGSSFEVAAILAAPREEASPSRLAATCAAGVKHYAQKHYSKRGFANAVHFTLYEDANDIGKGEWRILAECAYAPKALGWVGLEGEAWEWLAIHAQERAYTGKELEAKEILAEMEARRNYDKAGCHDYEGVMMDIGRLVDLSADEIKKLPYLSTVKSYPAYVFKNIEPSAPVDPPAQPE